MLKSNNDSDQLTNKNQKKWLINLKKDMLDIADRSEIRFKVHTTAFVAVNCFLFVINMLTSRGFPWFYFPLAGWSIGLVSHFQSMWNKRKRSRRFSPLTSLNSEQIHAITKIHNAEARYKSHRAAFLSTSAFLLGTNIITTSFPWCVFPVGAWSVGFLIHRVAYRTKIKMLKRNLKEVGVSWKAYIKSKPAGKQLLTTDNSSIGNAATENLDISVEYAGLIEEVSETREALLQMVESNEDLRRTCGPEFKDLLENYTRQIHSLAAMDNELNKTLSNFSQGDLQKEIDKLKFKLENAEDNYVRQEYEKTIQQYEKQKRSLIALENQKEVTHLRLTSALLSLRQIQIDLSRMRTMTTTTELTSVTILREKSDDLSKYLDDLREGYEELSI